jgi:pilus assembly protein CpaE
MSASGQIRAVIALDPGVDRQMVQSVLPQDAGIEFVGALDVYENSHEMLEETNADIVLVACEDGAEQVPPFIAGAIRQRSNRPVVVLVTGTPNGFVRKVFEAGADDIVSVNGPSAAYDVKFAVDKAVARKSGAAVTAGGGKGSLITVLGPKGGIGKTVTACNLAVALAEAGESVALVDLNLQFGDVGLAMGQTPTRTMFDLARSGGSMDAGKLSAYLLAHPTGVQTLLAPTRPEQAQAVNVEVLRGVYAVLRTMFDHVVLDTPPMFTTEVVSAIDLSSDLCMVGMLDALSLKTTKLGLEALDRMGTDRSSVRLVLNRADSRVGITPADVAAILGCQPDVLVPSHREIAMSTTNGMPIVAASGRSEAAKAFKALAASYAPTTIGKGRGARRQRKLKSAA